MVIDHETFAEIAVHLKLASDAILKTARYLAVISNESSEGMEEQWAHTLEGMIELNNEIAVIEKLLRATMEANKEEAASKQPGIS